MEKMNIKSTIGERAIVMFLETIASLYAFCGFSILMIYLISPVYPMLLSSTPITWTIVLLLFAPVMAFLTFGFRKLNRIVKVKIL